MVSSSGISFSGLGSGLDTSAIVQQLVALERIPIQLIEQQRAQQQSKLDKLNQFSTLVKKLQEGAEKLSTTTGFLSLAVSGASPDVATIAADSKALQGTHTVSVLALSELDRWAFDGVADPTTDLAAGPNETLTFDVGGESYVVPVDQDASSLEDIVAAIHEQAGDAVSASIVNTGTTSAPSYQLVLASKSTGEEGRITNIVSGIDGLELEYSAPSGSTPTSANHLTVGSNAVANIDGLVVTRTSNDFSDVLDGIAIDAVGVGTTTFTVDPDKASIRADLDDFVETYNDVMDFINTENTFTPAEGEDDVGSTGVLFGESALTAVKRALQRSLFNVPLGVIQNDTEDYSTLSNIGIEQNNDGTLEIDGDLFDQKILDNLDAFADLFVDRDGFERDPAAAVNTPGYYTDTTEDSGLLATLGRELGRLFGDLPDDNENITLRGIFDLRRDALRDEIKRFNSRIEEKERRLGDFEQSLILRFANLESLMGGLNAQGAALNAALGSL